MFYSEQAREIRRYLENKVVAKLEDVVELLIPYKVKNDDSKVFSFAAAGYPLNSNLLKTDKRTSTQLQAGDIVVGSSNATIPRMYLYNEDDQVPFYASSFSAVLRPRGISPEYLFLYLTSDTMQIIFESLSRGPGLSSVSKSDLLKIPVVAPEKTDGFYREEFLISNYKTTGYLELIKRRRALISVKEKSSSDLIENTLRIELLANTKLYLNNDFCEPLNIMYTN